MANSALSIGDLSHRTGVKIPTIRYYESIGLLPAPPRSGGNRRVYDAAHVERLNFIRQARDLGFTIEAITALITLAGHPDQPCTDADTLAREHRAEVRRKIAQLRALEEELTQLIDHCAHGTVSDCQILAALSRRPEEGRTDED